MFKRLLLVFAILFASFANAQSPTAAIIVPSNTICTSKTIIFNSVSTNTPTSFNWTITPNTGVSFLNSTTQTSLGVTFSYQGIYTVSLTVSNISGTFTAAQNITVSINPRASFSASLNAIGFPNELILTNFSSNATNYIWSYSDTPLTDLTTNATHSYTTSGAYSVTLTALNANGCSDSKEYSFYITDSSGVTLPNVFTPNADGVNDVFKPIARGIKSLNVNIYNRYGILVSTWDKVNGFWDGYTQSGMPCESGTYFCVLEAQGFDGKSYSLKTFISLYRN